MEDTRSGRRTLVMGVLNVTPDSFSDGGRYLQKDAALRRALDMAASGADIIDVGGESSRPGAEPVPLEEELRRVLPVIADLAREPGLIVSVDTRKAEVARAAIEAGAAMVNDISAMTADPDMAPVVAASGVAVCLMHMQGTPQTMQVAPAYGDVVTDVREYLRERAAAARAAGIAEDRIIVDPGFGFGKTLEHNLEMLRRLREFTDLGYPILVGTSRKSMLGALLGGAPPEDRTEGTAATVALAVANGASMVRVHDVREMWRVVCVADAVVRGFSPL
ncbi:MAG: dihydropteroate synthase [Chthonomonadales bacterium]|nr:dihydropteroate synthase [Chthonomonadales bacterium]